MSKVLAGILWPSIVLLPLVLTWNELYVRVFPKEYYVLSPTDYWDNKSWPSPLGLSLGILAVIVGQIFTLIYFRLSHGKCFGDLQAIQKAGAPKYDFLLEMKGHLSQPEGFVMLGGYLICTWMFGIMPPSYYSMSGGINWAHVALQLLCTDFFQYCMHIAEHLVDSRIYRVSHKPHHRFTNPKLFDAFNGSPSDTFLMILIPLTLTARVVNANVWSYMAFGSLYANWLCLIHAEFKHPWDHLFERLGMGTAAHHHVHHKLFKFNYGHTFMYWDMLFGTYKSPKDVSHFTEYRLSPSADSDSVPSAKENID